MPILPRLPVLATALALGILAPPLRADCIDEAAARHRVNALVLRAIGWQESRLRPQAFGRNANGSVDIGAFQINSTHLAELAPWGIDRASLTQGCVSAEVAAWHYRHQVEHLGDTWLAVGAYHSRTPARAAWYANRVATILMRWKVMPVGPLPFAAQRTLGPDGPEGPRRAGGRGARGGRGDNAGGAASTGEAARADTAPAAKSGTPLPRQTPLPPATSPAKPARPVAPIAPFAPVAPVAPITPIAPVAPPAPRVPDPDVQPVQRFEGLAFIPSAR